ncbi:hypothetical protein JCM21900_001613 [Sporobolomyces salmonicolor]
MMRAPTLLVRSLAPARSFAALRTLISTRPSPFVYSCGPASSPSRLLSTTAPLAFQSSNTSASVEAKEEKARKAKKLAGKATVAARKATEDAKQQQARARKEKEKARAKAAKEKEKERALKQKAKDKAAAERAKAANKKPRITSVLRPPKFPASPWVIYFAEYVAALKRNLPAGEKLPKVSSLVKEASEKYHELDPSAKEELARRYQEQKAAYPAILEAWKQTLTPAMIREENTVRATRRKLGLGRKKALTLASEPKKPMSAFILFSNEARARGPDSELLKGETNALAQSPLIAAAWRAMTEAEKQPYAEAYQQDKVRYDREKAEFEEKQAKKATSA